MAKGLGLIGNFRGKFGNAVGYNLKDSNNKQTQGIRIYQPIVKNPKTYAQAEQRARLAPINATYRLLKSVIDRGQEGIAYGNKSRLAWLKTAMKSFNGVYTNKGEVIIYPACVQLTYGSLPAVTQPDEAAQSLTMALDLQQAPEALTPAAISAALMRVHSSLKMGDQLTFVTVLKTDTGVRATIDSFVLSDTDTTDLSAAFQVQNGFLVVNRRGDNYMAGAIITSRESISGGHLRSAVNLSPAGNTAKMMKDVARKDAAIRSYMAGGAKADWPQERIDE